MGKRKKIEDIVFSILRTEILKLESLIAKVKCIVLENNPNISIEKIENSIKKLIGKKIYQWRNGYISLKTSPTTDDLNKLPSELKIDKELCEIYLEDFEVLENWFNSVEEKTMRQMSPIIRRMLVENDLQELWKHLGFYKQPIIQAPYLSDFLKTRNLNKILFLSTGGAVYKGMRISKVCHSKEYLTDEEAKRLASISESEKEYSLFKLEDFINSVCVIVDGEQISRREIIKYIANKLGGNHFDKSRKASKIENQALIYKYKRLDKIKKNSIRNFKAVYFELLSIVQAILSSDDIKKLKVRMQGVVDNYS